MKRGVLLLVGIVCRAKSRHHRSAASTSTGHNNVPCYDQPPTKRLDKHGKCGKNGEVETE
jgi:hypothetical protein